MTLVTRFYHVVKRLRRSYRHQRRLIVYLLPTMESHRLPRARIVRSDGRIGFYGDRTPIVRPGSQHTCFLRMAYDIMQSILLSSYPYFICIISYRVVFFAIFLNGGQVVTQ